MVVEYLAAGWPTTVVLHLDNSYYKEFLNSLQAKSGKPVDSPASKIAAFDPTEGSTDIDGTLPASIEKVAAALEPSMGKYGCKITPCCERETGRHLFTPKCRPGWECRRPRRPPLKKSASIRTESDEGWWPGS